MVNNIGYTEKTLVTTIGLTTTDILSEDITIISGEIGLGFLLFDLSGTIAVITAYENSNSFTLTTYATSYTIQAAISTTATAADLVSGKTAYVKSGKITGTVRTFTSSESWPAGYYMVSKSSSSIRVYGKPTSDVLYRAGSRVYVDVSNANLVTAINQRYSGVNTRKY